MRTGESSMALSDVASSNCTLTVENEDEDRD